MRDVKGHDEFTRVKKILQSMGSWVVRQASNTDIPDVTSGFRAYSREAALRLNVVSDFTYTLETIIQAGKSDLAVTHVPIRTNPRTRESRLFRSVAAYVKRSTGTIMRIWLLYEPLPVFLWPAAILGLLGLTLFGRFAWFYFAETGPTGHVQSLIVGAVLLVFSVQLLLLGVISELLRSNRVIGERTLARVRRIELALGVEAETLRDGAPDPRSESVNVHAEGSDQVTSGASRPRA